MAVNPLSPFVAANAVAITPSDTADITFMSLYVGTTGNLSILTANNVSMIAASPVPYTQAQILALAVTFPNVPVGFFPVAGGRVFAANTTAGGLIALF